MSTVTDEPRRFYSPAQRDAATFVETSAESGGARTLVEVELEADGGNRVHIHRNHDEHFEVLEGRLTLRLGDEKLTLEPGESAVAPAGSLHCFSNESGADVRFMVEMRPGHPGFEQCLQIGYGLAEDGRTRPDGMPKNLLHAALLLELSDIQATGPLGLLRHVLRPLAAIARRRGIERELMERYCRY